MTDHLPECEWSDNTRVNRHCICPALRACEQRVREEREADGPWFRSVVHDCCVDKQTAYAGGVQAARDAVAAIPHWDEDSSESLFRACDKDDALAAIDALRGES